MKTIFESEHIFFTEITEDLVKEYALMVNDTEHVGRLIGRPDPVTEEDERRWVQEKLETNAPIFSMIERESGDFIGNIELMDVHDGVGELGIAITTDKQDRGFGTEAIPAIIEYGITQLGLNRIILKAFPDNTRAIHVYEKCGFREYDRNLIDVFMEIKC